ncbi:Putative intradiol ring-cleavage dioxygenase, catechol dioxygenase [Colletotrichum destructivum]|uniref:Intradiol ring-cleavage dioxygenase, catechol dioxygenase n=1 Tax=Colletotrichum destructivum TaxID=34406 RepID=A0AAX4IG64_9PEZI|nr:Putative intradiol ring-cleavage dioxygenase, catechol dioxygenase [Colletotrichum destructivum]
MGSLQNGDGQHQGLGQDFTKQVIASMGKETDPRLRQVLASFIQHIHDFAREVDLTTDEWMAGVNMINWAGQMSNDRRNEGQLLCDVIGLESLVDDITNRVATKNGAPGTATAILGPFWRADTPVRPNGGDIVLKCPEDGEVAFMYGQVTCSNTGKPVANASVDVWQASTNGLYEQQDADQPEHNLRGKFITDEEGRYGFYFLRPTPYPVPGDGPAGKLLDMLHRHHYRPAHIHFIVQSEGFKSVTTQVFDQDSEYLDDDSVFAVKDGLTVKFTERKDDPKAAKELEYNIKLASEK